MNRVQVDDAVLQHLRRAAAGAYPEECCGALLGLDADDGRRAITAAIAVANSKDEGRARRYLIDPAALLAAERAARAQGLDVVGIYHSHPDHPSRPSEFDRVHAMPFWSYIIVSCMAGQSVQAQSWRLRDDRSAFDEEVWLDA